MNNPNNRLYYYQEVRNNYDAELRVEICKLILRKYRFERYRMNDAVIPDEQDLIVRDNHVRTLCQNRVNENICSQDQLFDIMNRLSVDQMEYIGIGN